MPNIRYRWRMLLILSFVVLATWLLVHYWHSSQSSVVVPLSRFPLQHYDQNIDHWLKPSQKDYRTPLLTTAYQQQRLQDFYRHYYASDDQGLSAWSRAHVEHVLETDPRQQVMNILQAFDNREQDKQHKGYAENFRPYSPQVD